MEYLIIDPDGGPCRYTILVGQDSRFGEDYGIRVTRAADGIQAQASHLTASIAAIDALAETLMSRQVSPEGLWEAVSLWKAQRECSKA